MLQQQSELLKKLSNTLTREEILSKPLLQYILENKHFDQTQIQWMRGKLYDIEKRSNLSKISMSKKNEQAQVQAIRKEQTQEKIEKKAIIQHKEEACLVDQPISDNLSQKQKSKIKKILITGAAGGLGRILRQGLRGKFNLIRCLDIMPMQPAETGQEIVQCSLTDKIKLNEAMKDIDCVVHLAAIPTENEWDKILQSNIDGCFNTYDLAHKNQVKRFIFASSNHAIGFHQRSSILGSDSTTRPDSRYGVSKVFGQALGRLYCDKHGMQVAILRIGTCNPQNRPMNVRHLSTWMSWRDWIHLVQASINHEGYEYEIVYGCSDNRRKFWDNKKTVIEYRPQDDAEEFAEEVLAKESKEDLIGDRYHGGPFCSEEYTKDMKKDKGNKESSN